MKSKDWIYFVDCLAPCQKKSPTLYLPIELYRIDLVDEGAFIELSKKYARIWRDLGNKEYKKGSTVEKEDVSCQANEELLALIRKREKELSRSLRGSHKYVLDNLPEHSRIGLSPLDDVFLKNTEVGKKIQKDLALKETLLPRAFSYDEKAKQLNFEGVRVSAQGSSLEEAEKLQAYYRLKYGEQGDDKLKFRGTFAKSSDPLGSDLTLRKEYLGGTVFNPQTKSSQLPFGSYPKSKDMWETPGQPGQSHFSGDGHNHSHGEHDHAH